MERHFDVDDRFALPPLDEILDDGKVRHDTVDVTKIYYDTSDHDLQAQGITLYRRDGDGETGWRLATPADGGHSELHWVGSDAPPAEAVNLLTGVTAGKPVVDVAKIHTTRERYRISGAKKRGPCLEVGDDRVRASVGERLLAWREIAVETAAGTGSSAKRLSRRLRAAGAQPSRHPSKLARVSPPAPTAVAANAASAALAGYLNTQIDEIVAGDIGLRRGQDPIHDTRVAIRRVRSTLRVFGKLLDRSQIGDMDGELQWFAGLLGEVRDCEVQQSRFVEALDGSNGIADELILGPVTARIRADLRSVELAARSRVSEAMESPRYLAIMAVLRRWRVEPRVRKDVTTRGLLERARAQSGSAPGRGASNRRRTGRHVASGPQGRQARPLCRRAVRTGEQREAGEANHQALQAHTKSAG